MAEIRVEKKSSFAWIWWLLGLLVLALIIWAVIETLDRDEAEVATVPVVTEPVVTEPVVTEPVQPQGAVGTPAPGAASDGIPVGQIVASPAEWAGRNVTGQVSVLSVVSDRGFWVEAEGQRLFVLVNEVPGDIKEINAGQTILMRNATIHQGGDPSGIPGDLDQQARQIVQDQPVVLTVDSLDVDILSTQAGTS